MPDTILDILHEQVNALGGASQSEYGNGYNAAILDALEIIEKHGGKDPLMLRAEIESLREALKQLETANDKLCALRSQATYEQMLSDEGTQDALTDLDRARSNARTKYERSGA